MKREDLFKFAMTAVCAAVLSACGSSGGDSKPSTGSTSTINKPEAGKTEAGKTEAGKTEAGKTEAGKTEAGKTEAGKTEAGKTEDGKTGDSTENATPPANNDKVDDVVLQPNPEATGPSNVGFKHVTKKDSGFVINTDSGNNGADKPAAMYVQNPFPSLDTIVVAEPLNADSQAPRGYLEDFDFRGSKTAKANESGKFTLKHIYKNTPEVRTGTKADDIVSEARPEGASLTKTSTRGKESGDALVYQDGRVNYTNNYSGTVYNADGSEADKKLAANMPRLDNVTDGAVIGTLAEVYGYRTFAKDGAMANLDKNTAADFIDEEQPNLPLVDKKAEHKAQLKNVQYGRVTSALAAHGDTEFKKGKNMGSLQTFVVNYGQFGDAMSENHYFYRGINNVGSKEIPYSSLGIKGKATYYGHAVSYGLDNNFMNGKDIDIPTAIGATMGLVSGNHVVATVDFDNHKVIDGRIYNTWYVSSSTKPNQIDQSTLVSFSGDIAANGNIAGNAFNEQTKTKGTFGATLFGKKAEELGGVVASDDKTEGKRWGAVFGAVRGELPKEPERKKDPKELENSVGSKLN